MFQLKDWQQQIASKLTAEQQQIWQQMEPFFQQLAPAMEALQQQKVEHAADELQRQKHVHIACFYGEESQYWRSIVEEDIEQLFCVTPQQLHRAVQQQEALASHIWLHGGVCIGDEELLQKQRVKITCTYNDQTHVMEGRYVYCDEANKQLEQLTKRLQLPFIPDVYAKRFYVLRVEKEAALPIAKWPFVQHLHIAPLEQEEAIQLHVDARPLWNVHIEQLQKKRGVTKLVGNGLRRQTFSIDTTEHVTPILCARSVICGEAHDGNKYEVTVEMPENEQQLQAYVTLPIHETDRSVHNNHTPHVSYTLQQEPTMAELQQLTAMYQYLAPLTIVEAAVHSLPLHEGRLMRKDALTLIVEVPNDIYAVSRCRALQQAILHYWAYGACDVKQVSNDAL